MYIDIENTQAGNSNIYSKKIDKNSEAITMMLLQENLYEFKERAVMRELTSNCKDAIVMRDIAKSILNGESKEEDHFIEVDSPSHQASKFNPDYYNLDYLSDDPNIYITLTTYQDYSELSIKDYGVGLFGANLLGFFDLNYSTKRTCKDVLGAYGLGSKSPFGVVKEYDIITTYNGLKTKIKLSKELVMGMTQKFTGNRKNTRLEFSPAIKEHVDNNGDIITAKDATYLYWEESKEKNGLESIMRIPKSLESTFIDAAKSQLMYVPNVVFKHVRGVNTYDIDVSATILYQDDNCIISDNDMYTVPHILLGSKDTLINYGPINFDELDQSPKKGSIGIIVNASDVNITPNREKIVWDAKARNAISNAYKETEKAAQIKITEALSTDTAHFMDWIQRVSSIMNKSYISKDSPYAILSVFSKILNIGDLGDIKYEPMPHLKYAKSLILQFGVDVNFSNIGYNSNSRTINYANLLYLNNMYLVDVERNDVVDKYLRQQSKISTLVHIGEDANLDNMYIRQLLEYPNLKKYSEIVVPEFFVRTLEENKRARQSIRGSYSKNTTELTLHHICGTSKSMLNVCNDSFYKDPFTYIGNCVIAPLTHRYEMANTQLLTKYLGKAASFYNDRNLCSNFVNEFRFVCVNKSLYKNIPFCATTIDLKDFYIQSYRNNKIRISKYLKLLFVHVAIADCDEYEKYKEIFHKSEFEYSGTKVAYSGLYEFIGIPKKKLPMWVQYMYEIALNNAGIPTELSKEVYLEKLDKYLPDFLAESIDVIEDVVGFDKEYFEYLRDCLYNNHTGDELDLYRLISSASWVVLDDVNYNFIQENDKIQKEQCDTKNRLYFGQALPERPKEYFTRNFPGQCTYRPIDS